MPIVSAYFRSLCGYDLKKRACLQYLLLVWATSRYRTFDRNRQGDGQALPFGMFINWSYKLARALSLLGSQTGKK